MTRSRQTFALWSAAAGLLLGVWLAAVGIAADDRRGPTYALGETAAQSQADRPEIRFQTVSEDWSPGPAGGDLHLLSLTSPESRCGGCLGRVHTAGAVSAMPRVWFDPRAPPSGFDA